MLETGATDIFVLKRVSAGRFVHLGGAGRGEGWAGIVEVALESEADLDRAITLVEETGAIQETMRRARAYADAAKAALGVLQASEIRTALAETADFCVERAY